MFSDNPAQVNPPHEAFLQESAGHFAQKVGSHASKPDHFLSFDYYSLPLNFLVLILSESPRLLFCVLSCVCFSSLGLLDWTHTGWGGGGIKKALSCLH